MNILISVIFCKVVVLFCELLFVRDFWFFVFVGKVMLIVMFFVLVVVFELNFVMLIFVVLILFVLVEIEWVNL